MGLNRIQVVLIGDVREDYMITRFLLEDASLDTYEIHWISDFSEAVQALRAQVADIYLIDYLLGEKTGLSLVAECADMPLVKPMILLSGIGHHEIDLTAMEMGFSNFIPKKQITSQLLDRSSVTP